MVDLFSQLAVILLTSGAPAAPATTATEPPKPEMTIKGTEKATPQPVSESKSAPKQNDDEKKPEAGAESTTITPPSLTGPALNDELRRSVKDQRTERSRLEEERAKLETLAKEIERARQALKEETARLEALVRETPDSGATQSESKKISGGKSRLDVLSKSLSGMKPDQAAALIGNLDRKLAIQMLSRMRPDEVGALLGKMKPELAAELLSDLAANSNSAEARR